MAKFYSRQDLKEQNSSFTLSNMPSHLAVFSAIFTVCLCTPLYTLPKVPAPTRYKPASVGGCNTIRFQDREQQRSPVRIDML
eukprot:750920-Hanusia_phi.AAC.2